MTECTGAQTVNIQTAFRFESAGRTIPGVKTKIHAPNHDKEGEVSRKKKLRRRYIILQI